MTEVCEVWTRGELAALILGTVGLSTAGVAAIIAVCLWACRRPTRRGPAPMIGDRPSTAPRALLVVGDDAEKLPPGLGEATVR